MTYFVLEPAEIVSYDREMTETVAAATGQDNPGAVSEHDVNALAAHQVASISTTIVDPSL